MQKNIFLRGDNSKGIGGKETECLWKDCFPLTQERFSLTQGTFPSDARTFLSDGSDVSF